MASPLSDELSMDEYSLSSSVLLIGTIIPEEPLPQEKNSLSDLKRDENLWFEDGSIVLATDVHLFCVHKSILANNSSVFKDMLAMPSGGGTGSSDEEDTYEGKPVVKMVGDSDDDVRYLLMALYNHNFFRANNPTTAPILLSLLYASSKYDVPAIRSEVIKHLKSYYADELPKLRKCDLKDLVFGSDSSSDVDNDFDVKDFAFQLLSAGLRANLKEQLPTMYMECAGHPPKRILRLSNKFSLGNDVIGNILSGREKLSKWPYFFAANVFSPQLDCNFITCWETRSTALFDWIIKNQNHRELTRRITVEGVPCFIKEELSKKICADCLKRADTLFADVKSKFWPDLPKIFGLGTWEDLKKSV
ncbi:hypothetical protein SCHPADRAFT_945780 [Schizopora paradoxa]|uniref:BTB domain-containing protein n=1 Tax=Schizopora paradoxa TaxID=27342 RepID=A0A0H2R4P2_9AGAM|nr:hypothetical protein SCHPADRAFT_945780 [Schizopora paradoxa]